MTTPMTNLIPEQTVAATKASFDTAFGLASKAFEGFEKLFELNAQTVKTTLAEAQELAAKSLSSKAPQAVFAVQTGEFKPAIEKAQAYWKHVNEIVSSTQAEFEAAGKTLFNLPSYDTKALFDNLSKNALPGSEAVVALWKSGLAAGETAGAAYTAARKSAKQVVENAESAATNA